MTTLKQATGAKGSQILGLGAARGDLVVANSELVEAIDSSDEWIRQRTGIITRKRASKGIDAIDLAETASLEAIRNAGIEASQIEAVIVSTISNVAVTPSMSRPSSVACPRKRRQANASGSKPDCAKARRPHDRLNFTARGPRGYPPDKTWR